MKEENEIDRLFKEGLYNREIKYDPKAWDEVEKMISDQEKGRGFLYRFRFYLSALAILLLSTIYVFTNGEIKHEENDLSIERKPSKSESHEKMNPTSGNVTAKKDTEKNSVTSESAEHESPIHPVARHQNATETYATDRDEFSSSPGQTKKEIERPVRTSQNSATKRKEDNLLAQRNPSPTSENLETDLAYLNFRFPEVNDDPGELRKSHNPPDLKKTKLGNGVKVLAGIGITEKYDDQGNQNGLEPTYFIGLGFEKYLGGRMSLEGDLLFSQRNALNLSITGEEIEYDFGFESTSTEHKYLKLNYLEIPFILNYYLSEKHVIGGGIKYSYLSQTKVKTSITQESSFETEDGQTNVEWVDSDLFEKNDLSLVFRYSFYFKPRLGVGLSYQKGLKNMNIEGIQKNDFHNSQVRISIIVKPWK